MRTQFLVLLTSRGCAAVLQAATAVVVARAAGISAFGLLSATTGVATVYFVVTDLGLLSYIARARARGDADALASALSLNTATSIVGGAVAVAVATGLSLSGFLQPAYIVLALALSMEKPIETLLSVPVADGRVGVSAATVILRRMLGLVILLATEQELGPILAYAVGYACASLLGQAHIRLYLKTRVVVKRSSLSIAGTVQKAFPFYLANLTAQVRSLDTALVAAILTPYSAGLYAAAARLAAPFYLIPTSLTTIVLPRLSRAGQAGAWRFSRRLCKATVVLECGLLPVLLLSEPITEAVFGSAFRAAGPILAWTLVSLPLIAVASPLGSVLQANDDEKFVARNGVIFAILTVAAIAGGALLSGPSGAAAAVGLIFLGKDIVLVHRIRTHLLPAITNLNGVT